MKSPPIYPRILRLLQEIGPLKTSDIAAALGVPVVSIVRSGNVLAASQQVIRRAVRCNDTDRIWYIPNLHPGELVQTFFPEKRRKGRPGTRLAKTRIRKTAIAPRQFITAEDIAYQQAILDAAEQRRIARGRA